jgi:uncharacterized BrkB/YihY/UPF0761 family membrane protein
MRPERDSEPIPLDPRVERAVHWLRDRVPGGGVGLQALERETTAGGTLIAGGLAYRLFLWLLPFGLVVAAVASFWERGDPDGLESSAEEFGLSESTARSMSQVIAESSKSRWYFLIIGLWFLIWFAIGVVRALRVAHAVAWRAPRERFRRPVHAGLLFTLFATGLIVISGSSQWLREHAGVGGLVATLLLVFVYAAGAVWAMRLLPHGDAPWTALIPGAILVGAGLEGLHLFTALYLVPRLGRSSELYGSLGAATVILLWLYIIARLVTLSAFLNATLWERRQLLPSGEETS